jgi:hypothetical protein
MWKIKRGELPAFQLGGHRKSGVVHMHGWLTLKPHMGDDDVMVAGL